MGEYLEGNHTGLTPQDFDNFKRAFPGEYVPTGAESDKDDVEVGVTATSPNANVEVAPGNGEHAENAGPEVQSK